MKKRKKIGLIVIAGIVIAGGIAGAVIYLTMPKVNKEVFIETGTKTVTVKEFLCNTNDEKDASIVTDVTKIDYNSPGNHQVTIKIGEKEYQSLMKVQDTVAPEAEVKTVTTYQRKAFEASEFVHNVKDATKVIITYKEEPKWEALVEGENPVTVVLTDEGGNKTEYASKIIISNVAESVTMELGFKAVDLKKEQFILNKELPGKFVTDITTLNLSKCGTQEIKLLVGDKEYTSKLIIEDTIAPKAKRNDCTIYTGQTPKAELLVKNVKDASKVTASFEEEPSTTFASVQEVVIILTDESGNQSKVNATLKVKVDNDPPVFEGIKDRYVVQNGEVNYRRDVKAMDKKDGELKISVDDSAVNLKKVGTYIVTLSATDAAGNYASAKMKVHVLPAKEANKTVANDMADDILANMKGETKKELAKAIYNWTASNIRYGGSSSKGEELVSACEGIVKKNGDSFTFYSISDLLLSRAGIDSMCVKRTGGNGGYYWNLAKVEGGWYHFDACVKAKGEGFSACLVTDRELQSFARQYERKHSRFTNYYSFDKSKYPKRGE